MDLYLVDDYPADAAFGCDFLSRNAKGQVQVETPDGPVLRDEKIIVTSHAEDWTVIDGRVCIGERTVRYLAHKLGLVDEWRVDAIKRDNEALRAELVALSTELGKVRTEANTLAQLERPDQVPVYVDITGQHHANDRAALEASARALNLEPAILQDAIATGNPLPEATP